MQKVVINGKLVEAKWVSLHGKGQLREMFDSCDSYFVDCDEKGDYQLTIDEADNFLEDFCRASTYQKEELFSIFDVDADGYLSAQEFRTAYLMYDMLLLDEVPIAEFIQQRQITPFSPPITSSRARAIPVDPWIGKDVEVRWQYNTVDKLLQFRWENAKVEDRNPDGSYQVLFEGDAYSEKVEAVNIRPRSRGSLRIVVVGRPGAGKRTQSANFIKTYDIVRLNCEQLLQRASTEATEFGRLVKAQLPLGDPIPDKVIVKVIQERISKTDCMDQGFILEGFPNNAFQARALDEMLGAHCITHVFNLRVPTHILKERISGRLIHKKSSRSYHDKYNPPKMEGLDNLTKETLVKQPGDNPLELEQRIEEYKVESKDLLRYYRAKQILRDIDASSNDPEAVWKALQESFEREPDDKDPGDIDKEEKYVEKSVEEVEISEDEPFPPLIPLDEEEAVESCECVLQ